MDIMYGHELLSSPLTNNQSLCTLHTNKKELGNDGYSNSPIDCTNILPTFIVVKSNGSKLILLHTLGDNS